MKKNDKNDWETLLERRLRDDLDAFLADSDSETFAFADFSDKNVGNSDPLRLRQDVDQKKSRRFWNVGVVGAASVAILLGVVGAVGRFGDKTPTPGPNSSVANKIDNGNTNVVDVQNVENSEFSENIATFKTDVESEFKSDIEGDYLAVCGVQGVRVVDSALRRVGEWTDAERWSVWPLVEKNELNSDFEEPNSENSNNDVEIASNGTIAPNGPIGTVLKNDPVFRIVDEYYLSDSDVLRRVVGHFREN